MEQWIKLPIYLFIRYTHKWSATNWHHNTITTTIERNIEVKVEILGKTTFLGFFHSCKILYILPDRTQPLCGFTC